MLDPRKVKTKPVAEPDIAKPRRPHDAGPDEEKRQPEENDEKSEDARFGPIRRPPTLQRPPRSR